jgi:Tol biopolymer transport system component
VDLPSNSSTVFDADPAWSTGGQTIAFDRTDASGTNVYSMAKEGTNVTQLTTSGTDSNPNWSPDNKNLVFQSARGTQIPGVFANVSKPLGVLALSDHLLITQANKDKVLSVSSNGTVTTFATLPSTGNADTERYLAQSPGTNGWPVGEIYVTVGRNIYQISPDGSSVTSCVALPPPTPNGETSITFDTVGTFGFNMLLSDRTGPVWSVTPDCVLSPVAIGNFFRQIEGIAVAPLAWAPFSGQLVGANEFSNQVYALDPSNMLVSPVGTWTGPEAAVFVPPTVCNMTGTTGAYFVALEDQNQILSFPASSFVGLPGVSQALVPSELDTSIGLFWSDGTQINVSQFWGPTGNGELEGSSFAQCAASGHAASAATPSHSTGAPAGPAFAALRAAAKVNPAARAYAALAVTPHDVFRMTSSGASQTNLTNSPTVDDIEPVWSPNNQTMLFASDQADPNAPGCQASATCDYQLFTVSANGGTQTDIDNSLPASDTSSDWQAAGYLVTIVDFAFQPSTAKPKQGASVLWTNRGDEAHTVTDNTGMGLYDSGNIAPDGAYILRFLSAGKFAYFCTIHPTMTGIVQVPIIVAPLTGTVSTTFTVTWSAKPNQPNLVFDVQIQRPGQTTFSDWKTGIATASATFVPDSGTGSYAFRSRVRSTLNGAASQYSAPVAITVTP